MFAALSATAVVVALGAPALAKTETIKGEIVEQTCYRKEKTRVGASHNECAEVCAKKGAPMALLTADGKLYQIAGALAADSNAKLVPHIAHTVEITGEVTEKDGKMTIAADTLKMTK